MIVSIALAPGEDLLEQTHKFIAEYVRQRFLPAVSQSITVGAYELLSNACDFGSVTSEIVLELLESPSSVAIRVTNEAIPARIEMLQQHMTRLSGGAEAVFVEEMRRSITGGLSRPVLGLARVAHEAGLTLEPSIGDRKVTMTARKSR